MQNDKDNTPATPAPAVAKAPAPAPKGYRYIGPGSAGHADREMPTIKNLPASLKRPDLGINPNTYHADELPERYIPYVMETSPHTKGWWSA